MIQPVARSIHLNLEYMVTNFVEFFLVSPILILENSPSILLYKFGLKSYCHIHGRLINGKSHVCTRYTPPPVAGDNLKYGWHTICRLLLLVAAGLDPTQLLGVFPVQEFGQLFVGRGGRGGASP